MKRLINRIEEFYDLSLNVKGCRGLIDSLHKYVEREKLDGENKVHVEWGLNFEAASECIPRVCLKCIYINYAR